MGRSLRQILRVFLVVFLVASCTDRTNIVFSDDAAQVGTHYQTFVATLRKQTEGGWFGGERSDTLAYMDLEVSVPPAHRQGRIRFAHSRADAARDFVVARRTDYQTAGAFSDALRKALRQRRPGERGVMLYVHGYNNSFADGVFRTTQLMHDFELPGVGVHFSWPSAAHPLGYAHDRDSVLYTRDGLEKFLTQISAAGPDRIILIGHSLGAMLVMETLRQIEIRQPGWANRHLGGVVLVSPDLDIEVFKQQTARFKRLPQPFIIFVSDGDRALQLSSAINGDKQRLGLLADEKLLGDLPVTVVDVSEFAASSDDRHFTVGTSELLIQLLRRSDAVGYAFDRDAGGRTGLLPGTALTLQGATKIILSPLLLQN